MNLIKKFEQFLINEKCDLISFEAGTFTDVFSFTRTLTTLDIIEVPHINEVKNSALDLFIKLEAENNLINKLKTDKNFSTTDLDISLNESLVGIKVVKDVDVLFMLPLLTFKYSYLLDLISKKLGVEGELKIVCIGGYVSDKNKLKKLLKAKSL